MPRFLNISQAVALAVLIVLCLAHGLSAEAGQSLKVLTEDLPASNYVKDGRVVGFCADIVREVERRLGMSEEMSVLPWARGYKMLLEEPDVVLFCTTRTEEREHLAKWAGPIAANRWALYARKGSGISLGSLDEAREVSLIGTCIDDARDQFLLKEGFRNLDRATMPMASLRKLAAGRIDLLVSGSLDLPFLAAEAGLDPALFEVVHSLGTRYLYIAFSRDVPDQTVAAWQRALDQMRVDGTHKRILQSYVPGERVPPKGTGAP